MKKNSLLLIVLCLLSISGKSQTIMPNQIAERSDINERLLRGIITEPMESSEQRQLCQALDLCNKYIGDTLLGRKAFFVRMLGVICMIGVKESDGCSLTICHRDSTCTYTEHYFLNWLDYDIKGIFDPLPDMPLYYNDRTDFYYYQYFVRFTAEGEIDLEYNGPSPKVGNNRRRSNCLFENELPTITMFWLRYSYWLVAMREADNIDNDE